MSTVLELRHLAKKFPSHTAVNGISLALERGEFFSLVGPSGCGKTTTLRLIAGFETPTTGDVLLNGVSLAALPPYQRDVSTVFQNYALFPHLTVLQNVAFGLERKRVAKASIQQKVSAVLEQVQLTGKENRLPGQISGGERQRVALARSLVLEPQLLLLDEPLSALDPMLRKQMRAELKTLQRRVGITFLFVTHDQEEALSLSDRMAVMNQGNIEQAGAPQDLYRHPGSRFVAEFLGGVNWIDGTCLRPECMHISHSAPDSPAKFLPATVEGSTFLGNRIHVATRLQNGSACTVETGQIPDRFTAGQSVHVWWRPEDELRISPDA